VDEVGEHWAALARTQADGAVGTCGEAEDAASVVQGVEVGT
jgi:hypothetical protein